jgi:hypothetical protein
MKLLILVLSGLLVFCQSSYPQNIWQRPPTKIEAFQARTGTVVVRAFATIGAARVLNESVVRVEYDALTDVTSGEREYGIVIYVHNAREPEEGRIAFIDYDEIDSLVKSIEYIAKTNGSVTELPTFEASYRSRGGLEIASFGDKGGAVRASVTTTSVSLNGTITQSRAIMELSNLSDLGKLIAAARAKLDLIRENPK